jgi:hypothetical protein
MSAAPPTVFPVFSTPFGIAPLPQTDGLNLSLLESIAARRKLEDAALPNPLVYRSRDDFFERPELPARQLCTEMLRSVIALVEAVNCFEPEQLAALKVEARGWFTVIGENGRVSAMTLPLAAWCAVYCVAAPMNPSPRPDGGVLRLYESRLGTMFQDATNSVMRLPFTHGHYAWRPLPGSVAIFPASLTHEITLLRTPGELVLVTAGVRFVAPGQQGMGRW